MATQYASIKLSELSIGIGPFVIEPAVSRKIGTTAMTQMTMDAETFPLYSFRSFYPIDLKLQKHTCLHQILVKFDNQPDPSRNYGVMALCKLQLFNSFYPIVFEKKYCLTSPRHIVSPSPFF